MGPVRSRFTGGFSSGVMVMVMVMVVFVVVGFSSGDGDGDGDGDGCVCGVQSVMFVMFGWE